jgi:hypothetical protein
LSTKADKLAFRREKVIMLKSRGLNHSEIAHELQISRPSIVSDVNYLRREAKESIRNYITEFLPMQYKLTIVALDDMLKHAYKILDSDSTSDDSAKLEAMRFYIDVQLLKVKLFNNSPAVDNALNYIRSEQSELERLQRLQQQIAVADRDTDRDTDDNNQTVF